MNATNNNTWTVSKIREAMTAAGSNWWNRDTMKFFGTRALPTVYQGGLYVYFVTSEQPPHGPRAFSVRRFDITTNAIKTIGELCAHVDAESAKTAAKLLAGQSAIEIVEPLEGQDAKKIAHSERIERMLSDCDRSDDYYKKLHAKTWRRAAADSTQLGCSLVQMIVGAARYADAHAARFESDIGEDGFIGPEWVAIIRACRTLLNGETEGLDCGTIDGLLLDMLQAEGVEE